MVLNPDFFGCHLGKNVRTKLQIFFKKVRIFSKLAAIRSKTFGPPSGLRLPMCTKQGNFGRYIGCLAGRTFGTHHKPLVTSGRHLGCQSIVEICSDFSSACGRRDPPKVRTKSGLGPDSFPSTVCVTRAWISEL